MYDQCKYFEEFKTIQNCTERKTFDWRSTIKDIHIGMSEFKESMMNETLWTEDFTVASEGKHQGRLKQIGENMRFLLTSILTLSMIFTFMTKIISF